jgi:NAD(P)H-dependent FMN reductase
MSAAPGEFLILSCSLNPASRSHRLALEAQSAIEQ